MEKFLKSQCKHHTANFDLTTEIDRFVFIMLKILKYAPFLHFYRDLNSDLDPIYSFCSKKKFRHLDNIISVRSGCFPAILLHAAVER